MKTLRIFLLSAIVAVWALPAHAQKQASKNNIDTLINSYMAIKNALVANDGTAAHFKANEMYNILKSQPTKGLSKGRQKIMIDYLDRLLEDCEHITGTTYEEHQREVFANLSRSMYYLLQELKLNRHIIYRDYCPMKQVYWLSESAAIKNPYYGNRMLTCGRVVEKLPAR